MPQSCHPDLVYGEELPATDSGLVVEDIDKGGTNLKHK